MNHFWKSSLAASLLCLAATISPAIAGQTYFVIKSQGNADFPVTDETVTKLGEIEFKVPLGDVDGEEHLLKGPRLRDLLAAAGAAGKAAAVKANDGYEAEIPASDIADYDVIVAVTIDGKPITIDENGPSRIAYPVLDVPKLKDNEDVTNRSVFQIKEVTAK